MYMSMLVNPRARIQRPNQDVRCLPPPLSTDCLETGSPTKLSSPFKKDWTASKHLEDVCLFVSAAPPPP